MWKTKPDAVRIQESKLGRPLRTEVLGTRIEGTLLNTPVLRIKAKSDFLLKLENRQREEQRRREEEFRAAPWTKAFERSHFKIVK